MRFRELDDFHPDRIYRESRLFQELRELRSKLEDPSTFAAAAAEIRGWSEAKAPAPPPPPKARRPDPPPLAPGASLLDAILEEAEAKTAQDTAAGTPPVPLADQSEFRRFVESVVAPHSVPAEHPELPRLRALLNAEASARMRALLHHPAFQALESVWRSGFRLIRAIETGSQLKVYLLDISKAELAADLSAAGDSGESRIRRLLVRDPAADGAEAWSLVAGDFSFAQSVEDAQMLARLAGILSAAGAPFVGEADPRSSAPEPEEGAREWERLRQVPESRWIGLAMPRLLLRLPYGKKADVIESFDFEEMPVPPEHGRYLWGNPAFVCVQLLAEAFARDGSEMCAGMPAEIDGLPLHVYQAEGEMRAAPCAEVLLTERDIEWILEQGYMALDSMRDRDVVRLVRFQSIARPPARLSGRWE
jgi:type VI secretion system protein ImpC